MHLLIFTINWNLSFVLSRNEAGWYVMARALAGCNFNHCAVCGNYQLHGSAVGNCYLYSGCQTIGFPLLMLTDIILWCVAELTHRVCDYLWHTNTVKHVILLANTSKGQGCHSEPHVCLLEVVGYFATRDAADNHSAMLPEQLCSMSSDKKLIKSKFMFSPNSHYSISTQTEDIHVSITGIIRLLLMLCVFFFNRINMVLSVHRSTSGRGAQYIEKKN